MKNRKRITIAIILILLLVLAVVLLLWWKSRIPSKEKQLASYKEGIAKLASQGNVPITFYGLVVDEADNPVPNAEVEMSWRYYTIAHIQGMGWNKKSVKTDEQGRFVFSGEKGFDGSVREIRKDGYEWIVEIKPSYDFINPETDKNYLTRKYYSPDPDNPVRFVMRKKNPATLVFKKMFHPEIIYDGKLYYYDVVYNQLWKAEDEHFFESKRRYRTFLRKDLLFKAKKSADDKNCILTFSTPGEGNGIQQSGKITYTAPETGYQKEITVTLPISTGEDDEGERALHLYLKLRTGMVDGAGKSIYAGMIGKYHRITERWIGFDFTTHVNPSGGRSLDYSREEYKNFLRKGSSWCDDFMNNVGFDEKPNYQR